MGLLDLIFHVFPAVEKIGGETTYSGSFVASLAAEHQRNKRFLFAIFLHPRLVSTAEPR